MARYMLLAAIGAADTLSQASARSSGRLFGGIIFFNIGRQSLLRLPHCLSHILVLICLQIYRPDFQDVVRWDLLKEQLRYIQIYPPCQKHTIHD